MLSHEFCDVTISINDSDGGAKEFKARRFHLAKHSRYFRALFYGTPEVQKYNDNNNGKEISVTKDNDIIYITGVIAESFECLMYFMYPSRSLGYRSIWNLSEEEEFDVFKTAEVFDMAGLKKLMGKVVSERPYDVSFQVDDGKVGVREFKAHKKYLAMANEYFKAMFFGPLGVSKDTFEVKGVTAKSFEIVIYYIYPNGEVVDYIFKFGEMSVEELFDVVNAAEMFDVAGLKEVVKRVMSEKPMNLTNVVEFAYAAEQFSLFTDVSLTLLDTCVSFLCQTLESRVLDFSGLLFCEEHEETLSRLFNLTMEKPPALPEPICTGRSCTHHSCLVKEALAFKEERRMKHALDFYASVMPPL